MTDEEKKEQDPVRARDRLKDDFWDLDRMLPRKAPRAAAEFTRPEDTETVEITFDAADNTDRIDYGAFAPVKTAGEKIPPMPNITSRMNTADAKRNARETLAARAHTPGDVRPQMSVPVCSYTPKDSFLKQVSVFRWPSQYSYYAFERFTSDAERYFNRAAGECPFVNFFAYMPQYSEMSQDQLRWYLYWRDNVRHGVYLTTDYSYIFLYIYEIINLPEKVKPADGVKILCELWLAYREKFPRLDRYMGEWICDYCLIWEQPAPLDLLAPIIPGLVDKLSFKEFFIRCDKDSDCPFTESLCDLLSNYNWRQSKYALPENRPLFETHLYGAVLGALRKAWKESPDFSSLLGLSEIVQSRNAFSGALCSYSLKRRIDISYISLSRSYQLRFILTDCCKMAENCIRAHLGIKARLTANSVPDLLKTFIRTYFDEHLPPYVKPQKTEAEKREERQRRAEERQRAEEAAYAPLYEPLSTALSKEEALKLEKTSWANTELLVPETEAEAEEAAGISGTEADETVRADKTEKTAVTAAMPDDPAAKDPAEEKTETAEDLSAEEIPDTDDPYLNFVNHLSRAQFDALKHVLCQEEGDYLALCARENLLPDAMTDAINEVAVTYTDDTVLESDGGSFFRISEYYINEVSASVVMREDSGI